MVDSLRPGQLDRLTAKLKDFNPSKSTKEERILEGEKDSQGVSYRAKWVESEMLINAIGEALDGEEPSDFEQSYPIVRKAMDLFEAARNR